jgi:hypothetical protein
MLLWQPAFTFVYPVVGWFASGFGCATMTAGGIEDFLLQSGIQDNLERSFAV